MVGVVHNWTTLVDQIHERHLLQRHRGNCCPRCRCCQQLIDGDVGVAAVAGGGDGGVVAVGGDGSISSTSRS